MTFLLDLSCADSIKVNNAIFFIMTVTSCFIFLSSFLSDWFGRKSAFVIISTLQVAGAVISLVRLDYTLIVFGVGVQIMCTLNSRLQLVLQQHVHLHGRNHER